MLKIKTKISWKHLHCSQNNLRTVQLSFFVRIEVILFNMVIARDLKHLRSSKRLIKLSIKFQIVLLRKLFLQCISQINCQAFPAYQQRH